MFCTNIIIFPTETSLSPLLWHVDLLWYGAYTPGSAIAFSSPTSCSTPTVSFFLTGMNSIYGTPFHSLTKPLSPSLQFHFL